MNGNTSTEFEAEVRPFYRVARTATTGIVIGSEWDLLSSSDGDEGNSFNIVQSHLGWQNHQYLGLHECSGSVRPSHFVGARWLDEPQTTALVVKSKLDNVDTVRMFSEILEKEGQITEGLFGFYPEQRVITSTPLRDLSLLQIAVFLKELARFCQHDLRMGFIPVRENLTGKVKGRVLVSEQMRRNLTRGRADRTVCAFTVISIDTLPNRMLRWALHLCLRYLAHHAQDHRVLWNWGRVCESALAGVSLTPVHHTAFRGLIYAGFMQRYRYPHALARMIITRLCADADGNVSEYEVTVPFYLDMNCLFERYVGVKLREQGFKIKPQAQASLPSGNQGFPAINFRPDYIAEKNDEIWIIDAKYKRYFQQLNEFQGEELGESIGNIHNFGSISLIHADIYQALAYATMWPNRRDTDNRQVDITVLAVPTTKKIDFINLIKNKEFPKIDLSSFSGSKLCLGIIPIPLPLKKS